MTRRIVLSATALILCLPLARFTAQTLAPDPVVDRNSPEWKAREALIARAAVFVPDPPDIASIDLSRTIEDPVPFDSAAVPECHYIPKPATATTPKFDCRLPDGRVVKVKYGRTPERLGEVAATRLLAALGFGADRTTMVARLRCVGCPPYPFQLRILAEWFFAAPLYDRLIDDDSRREFEWVSVERKWAGRAIEIGGFEGWDWSELKLVDPAKGGATRAELDALRLTAIFLSHWDNKAANQRLVCEEGDGDHDPRAPCRHPFLMLQDVGATFGPTKVQHDKWAGLPIWKDPATCTVSMENLPYRGGHFTPVQISEEGRVLIARRLTQLSETQIRTLFQAAHFPDPASGDANGHVAPWVRTFLDKVRQIADRPPCPPLRGLSTN